MKQRYVYRHTIDFENGVVSTTKHDLLKQPKWVQEHITTLENNAMAYIEDNVEALGTTREERR
jgi:hypothetical protein